MVRLPASGSVNARTAIPITRGNQASEVVRLSPDGKWLAYDSDLNGNADIFIVPSDGGTPRQLTDNPSDDLAPDWSPDGTIVSFHSFRTGNRDVFTVGTDGSGLAQVTTDTLSDRYALWGANDNTLAFSRGDADLEILETKRPSKSAPWGPPLRVAPGITTGVTFDRSAYLFRTDSSIEAAAIRGARKMLFRLPHWFNPNWIRMGPDGRKLYTFSPDTAGDPAYWSVDLRTGTLRKLVTFDHPEVRTVRGVFDTDGHRFYFVAGEHQADIWVADVAER
jgi:Tol biopolymer transport system component